MATKIKDMVGQAIEKLTVIGFSHVCNRKTYWFCMCSCDGKTIIVKGTDLRRRRIISCGCIPKAKKRSNNINLAGKIFNRLLVVKAAPSRNGHSMWKVRCSCNGNEFIVRGSSLLSEGTQSCGCLRADQLQNSIKTHNMSRTRFYKIWSGIVQRCTNPNDDAYSYYGGRGIKLYEHWLKFENFFYDEYEGYVRHVAEFGEADTTADRYPDVNGNYERGNFRWATREEQSRNTRECAKTKDYDEHIRQKKYLCNYLNGCLAGRRIPDHFEERFGVTLLGFKKYIESQFQPGMTWNNHGKNKLNEMWWQLDHIVECNKFDLSKEEDRKKCFYYTNFQPLWWPDNMAKRGCVSKEI